MTPEWLNHASPEFIEALSGASRKLVEVMPDIERVVDEYIEKGAEMAEKHANEGDE